MVANVPLECQMVAAVAVAVAEETAAAEATIPAAVPVASRPPVFQSSPCRCNTTAVSGDRVHVHGEYFEAGAHPNR